MGGGILPTHPKILWIQSFWVRIRLEDHLTGLEASCELKIASSLLFWMGNSTASFSATSIVPAVWDNLLEVSSTVYSYSISAPSAYASCYSNSSGSVSIFFVDSLLSQSPAIPTHQFADMSLSNLSAPSPWSKVDLPCDGTTVALSRVTPSRRRLLYAMSSTPGVPQYWALSLFQRTFQSTSASNLVVSVNPTNELCVTYEPSNQFFASFSSSSPSVSSQFSLSHSFGSCHSLQLISLEFQ